MNIHFDLNTSDFSRFIKELFPDWEEIEEGSWSAYSITSDSTNEIEIGLYREPMDDPEFAGTYTLQGFWVDDVVLCQTVDL